MDVSCSVRVEGPRPCEHLVQDAAERPNVRSLVDRISTSLLRAHVRRGAENDAHSRQGRTGYGRRFQSVGAATGCLEDLGETEVQDLDRSVGQDLDVGRLQVTVNDSML